MRAVGRCISWRAFMYASPNSLLQHLFFLLQKSVYPQMILFSSKNLCFTCKSINHIENSFIILESWVYAYARLANFDTLVFNIHPSVGRNRHLPYFGVDIACGVPVSSMKSGLPHYSYVEMAVKCIKCKIHLPHWDSLRKWVGRHGAVHGIHVFITASGTHHVFTEWLINFDKRHYATYCNFT